MRLKSPIIISVDPLLGIASTSELILILYVSRQEWIRWRLYEILIRVVCKGREREVSVLVARGFTNEQIGEKLAISEPTVKTHLRNIYSKTGVHDRTQLVSRILKSEADFWNVEYHKLMRRLHQAQDDKNKT